ncbi:TetR/AcrR family transcriptional regulator [Arvimicrobium flavum]|uniref:TetR/AcrR family transcriptional regulator n=1 Tax=Arvimicrobium flavum TaxID=3393320 RepID=UPI00237A3EDE|nr:TetR/AcrR family transcriptional regulator [Mesorhizobium shangrilense]
MARTTGSDGERTEAAIREAALALIAQHGYEAMSMRQLAERVGVQAAALYRYFPTKEAMLFTLMREHMEDLLGTWQRTQPEASDPAARLRAFVQNHIGFHVEQRHSTHVSNMELRSLSRDNLSQILRMRTAYERELRTILRDGAEDGVFEVDDVGLTAMGIIQMITGVIVWFRPDERLSVAEVSDTYLKMTMRLVGNRDGRSDLVRPYDRLRAR